MRRISELIAEAAPDIQNINRVFHHEQKYLVHDRVWEQVEERTLSAGASIVDELVHIVDDILLIDW